MKKPTALILATGYQTNLSVLEALLNSNVLGAEPIVFCDRLCHVSLLLGFKNLARIVRFQHNDLTHLNKLLEKYASDPRPKFILVESVYSMDGDQADLKNLILLKEKYHAFLYVDDAHAVGVYGSEGFGRAADYANHIDIIMGTFSKGMGSFGGYIACSQVLRDYLINKCNGLIYSTGISPAILGAMDAALELIPQLKEERKYLLKKAAELRQFFQQRGLDCGNANTQIVPWIIGDANKTLKASQLLEQQGILGVTIRPPSVPVGKSRIRFCLSAAHSEVDISHLFHAIDYVEKNL